MYNHQLCTEIVSQVCGKYKIFSIQLTWHPHRRHSLISKARNEIMYRLYTETDMNREEIGVIVGIKNRNNIIRGVDRHALNNNLTQPRRNRIPIRKLVNRKGGYLSTSQQK